MHNSIWGRGLVVLAAMWAMMQPAGAQSFIEGSFDPAVPTPDRYGRPCARHPHYLARTEPMPI